MADPTPDTQHPTPIRVQLRFATLPRPLSGIAVHGWFVLFEGGRVERWEVWQDPDRGGTSWGHLHRDLMHPDRPVGGGPVFVDHEWSGAEAAALAAVLRQPEHYPFQRRYRAWPGPNSNTYVEWALREAGLEHTLDPRAIGRDFLGRYGFGIRRRGGAWQVGCPLAGLRFGAGRWEVHLLCLTFGVGAGEILTPWGRRRRESRPAPSPAPHSLRG